MNNMLKPDQTEIDHIDILHFDLVLCYQEKNVEDYKTLVNYLIDLCKQKYKRYDIVYITLGNDTIILPAGRLLTNLILLAPYCEFGLIPSLDRFLNVQFDSEIIFSHIDQSIIELIDYADFKVLNNSLADVITNLADLACNINKLAGVTINLYSIFELIKKDEKILDYLYWKIPTGLSFDETEKAIVNAGNELIDIISKYNTPYGQLLRSNDAINPDQFRQIFVTVGTKPSLEDGKVVEEPINTSFLHGMRNAKDFFICAIGARKALITNLKKVKDSGYLARKLILLVLGHVLDIDTEDCHTKHGIDTYILNHNHIKRLKGRYAIDSYGETYYLTDEILEYCLDNQLPIKLRSPVTCAGEKICHICGGKGYTLNKDINYAVYSAINISEQLTQGFLKNKHFLTTNSKPIDWPEEINKLFIVELTYLIADSNTKSITIRLEDIEETENELTGENTMTTSRIYVVGDDNKDYHISLPVMVELEEDVWKEAVIANEELTVYPKDETPVFRIDVENIDLSVTLNNLVHTIEKATHTDFNQAYYEIISAFIESDIKAPSTAIEIILRSLVKSADDNTKRLDFSKDEIPPYTILKLKQAIRYSASATNAIAFQNMKALLTSYEIFDKTERGPLDILFGG